MDGGAVTACGRTASARCRRIDRARTTTKGALLALAVGVTTTGVSACVHGPPDIGGARGTAVSADSFWRPPRGALPPDSAPVTVIPADFAERLARLSLPDVVDIALRNNTATHASWAQARAAAAAYGSQSAAYLPTLTGGAALARTQTVAAQTRLAGPRTTFGPSVTLSYLLFDFGGRAGATDAARQAVFAADFAHNATIENVVLQVEVAYYSYLADKALASAQEATVAEASTNLDAARQRRRVGVATIADELQAQTALAQAQLALQTTQGNQQIARGALAASMGLPANMSYDIRPEPTAVPIGEISESVDSLIGRAVRDRPDLAAARAQLRQAEAEIRLARARLFPSLTLGANAGRTYSDVSAFGGATYAATIGFAVPLFAPANQYDVLGARARADASAATAAGVRQQVVLQVFQAYYGLQTAAQRVRTSDALFASAQQSAEVARGRYREGVGSIIDLVTAQAALADARAQQIQVRFGWYTALAQLAHDAGVLGVHGEAAIRIASPPPAAVPTTPTPR